MSSSEPAQIGITKVTQTSPRKVSQMEEHKLPPPPSSPKRSTLTGETQITPPQNIVQDQRVQGQLEQNHIIEDQPAHDTGSDPGRGKRNKKSTYEVTP